MSLSKAPVGARSRKEVMSKIEPALLGKQSSLPASPDEAILDCVPNPYPNVNYVARFSVPEFTSLCPVTAQPDFARIYIDYIADELMIESKALKLFMGSFRNHGAFHEACTMLIADRLVKVLSPKWFRIAAFWYPRGGIPIDVFWQLGEPPSGALIPYLPNPSTEFSGR